MDRTDLAHVPPREALDDEDADKIIEKLTSFGLVRSKFPKKQASASLDKTSLLPEDNEEVKAGALIGLQHGNAGGDSVDSTLTIDRKTEAKMKGYEGDPCPECNNFTLVRNGTCLKCNTCGSTTGCS